MVADGFNHEVGSVSDVGVGAHKDCAAGNCFQDDDWNPDDAAKLAEE